SPGWRCGQDWLLRRVAFLGFEGKARADQIVLAAGAVPSWSIIRRIPASGASGQIFDRTRDVAHRPQWRQSKYPGRRVDARLAASGKTDTGGHRSFLARRAG